MKTPLLIGVQHRLQLWAGRAGGNASQWADTVLSPRAADDAAAGGSDSVQDSQYLSGFDSQFLDDPSLVAPAAAGTGRLATGGAAVARLAVAPAAAALAAAAPRAYAAAAPAGAETAVPAPLPAPLPAPAPAATSAPVPAPASAPRAWPAPAFDGGIRSHTTPAQIDRYVVQSRLFSDPAGPVYEAWDPVQQCSVAVRTVQVRLGSDISSILDPQAAADVRARLEQRVLAKARAAVDLRHPHIGAVLDAGSSVHGVYIAMERLQGRDMREALARGWRPRPSLAALIMRRVAEGLVHAHAQGVVHGDVNPANIFLDDQARPKLLNFGLAQAGRGQGLDRAETTAGSLLYLAPEQLLSDTADARTDIRAVGLVLYELLAMAPAFSGKTKAEVTRSVLANRPTPVHELRINTPRSLAAIALRAMATDPGHRYASAAELVHALADWSDRHAARKARVTGAGRSRGPGHRSGRGRKGLTYLAWTGGLAIGSVALLGLLLPVARAWMAPVVQPGGAAAAAPALAAPGGVVAAGGADGVALPVPAPASAAAPLSNPAVTTTVTATVTATESSAAPVTPDKLDALTAAVVAEREAAYAAKRFGIVALEVSPGAQVSVNGVLAGTTPPATQLKLPVGRQSIVLRSEGFDPYSITVYVRPDQAVELRHRFTR